MIIMQAGVGQTSGVPSGMIMLWSGAIVDIPAGWVLCNGGNGTPDLRDRFLLGAGDSFSVDQRGGDVDHYHGVDISHGHSLGPGDELIDANGDPALSIADYSDGIISDSKTNAPLYHALAYIMKT